MRRSRSIAVSLLLVAAVTAPAAAATPIGHSGHVGAYAVVDTGAHPGARCRYDAGAGSFYLASIRGPIVAMYGLRDELQEVGYRLLLQQHRPAGWRTVASGPMHTAHVEKDVGNGVAPSRVVRDPARHPNDARYRGVLKLIWFSNDDGSAEGRLRLRIDHHRRSFDGSQGAACKGQVPTGIGRAAPTAS